MKKINFPGLEDNLKLVKKVYDDISNHKIEINRAESFIMLQEVYIKYLVLIIENKVLMDNS